MFAVPVSYAHPVSLPWPLRPAPVTAFAPRRLLFGLLLGAGMSLAQAGAPAWLESARAACAEEFGDDARCSDQSFLQQQYAPETIAATREVARRAAIRRNGVEQRALREVLVKHTGLCNQKPSQYCPPNNLAACAEQLRQTCAVIKRQIAMCQTQTNTYCAQHSGGSKCVAAMANQCSNKNLSIDQILAKYPDLSPAQKAKLKQVATQLEQNTDKSLFGALASSFLQLLGYAI